MIAFTGDIEAMLYQVCVPEDQRSYLRFLWWPEGNLEIEPIDYEMCVHLFGGISSPSCSNFALRRTADDSEDEFGSEAAMTLKRNFYVDDMLKSKECSRSSIALISNIRKMCASGGFNLTKFSSNDKEVLESIPQEERSKEVKECDLAVDNLPAERALGVYWCVENDSLGFRIELKYKPLTRRDILSSTSSIYDPLGLAAPYLLQGRKILQELCSDKKEWDDDLSEEQKNTWLRWRQGLPLLEKIEVGRCYKPKYFGEVISATLHNFSDASQEGYGHVLLMTKAISIVRWSWANLVSQH